MIADDQANLLLQIAFKQFRLRQRGSEGARRINLAIGALAGATDICIFHGQSEIGIETGLGGACLVSGLKFRETPFYFFGVFRV